MAMTIEKPTGLGRDQQLVHRELSRIVRDVRRANALYDELPDARGGKIISVDIARFLHESFGTWDGRIRHTPSTGNAAGTYAHDRILRELMKPRERRRLLITAGAAGSGKTTSIKRHGEDPISDVDLVFDNQFKHVERATQILELAEANAWQTRVQFVYRPFEDVVAAVIERSQRTGRWNAVYELPAMHIEAVETICLLSDMFRPPKVYVDVIYNASERAGTRQQSVDSIDGLRRAGLAKWSLLREYHKTVEAQLEGAKSRGIVCEEVAQLIARA